LDSAYPGLASESERWLGQQIDRINQPLPLTDPANGRVLQSGQRLTRAARRPAQAVSVST
jgi:hypothetical protein